MEERCLKRTVLRSGARVYAATQGGGYFSLGSAAHGYSVGAVEGIEGGFNKLPVEQTHFQVN